MKDKRSLFKPLALTVVYFLLAGLGQNAFADFFVSSRFSNNVLRYDENSGDFLGVFASGPELLNPNGIAFGFDKHLYVGLGDGGGVLRYDGTTGEFLGQFVPAGSGGLGGIRDILFGPDGDLYVASGTTNEVLRFDGSSGDFLSVAATGNGMSGPVGLAFDDQENLYVAAALSNEVFVFDDGVFQQSFDAGPTHSAAVGLAFNPNGQLLVSQSVTNEVLAFDPETGDFEGVFIDGPNGIPIYMEENEGTLYVGAFATDSVWRYDSSDGSLIDQFVLPGSGALNGTHDFAFSPSVPEPGSCMVMIGVLLTGLGRRKRKRFH